MRTPSNAYPSASDSSGMVVGGQVSRETTGLAPCGAQTKKQKGCALAAHVRAEVDGEVVDLCKWHLRQARRGHEVEEVGPAPGRRRVLDKEARRWRIKLRAEVLKEEGVLP